MGDKALSGHAVCTALQGFAMCLGSSVTKWQKLFEQNNLKAECTARRSLQALTCVSLPVLQAPWLVTLV
jgi:hypothetical protein